MKTQHGGKREGAGRKKKEPTKVVRVPAKRPDFETIAMNTNGVIWGSQSKGFIMGAEYVWSTYINKVLKSKKKAK